MDPTNLSSKVDGISNGFERILDELQNGKLTLGCDDFSHGDAHHEILKDSLERFRLWAGSLGAYHPATDPKSLDHRLRLAPQVSARVHELLSALQSELFSGAFASSFYTVHLRSIDK